MNSRKIAVGMVLFFVLAHFSMHACPVIKSVTVTPPCICIKKNAKITAASIDWDIYTKKKMYRWRVKTKGIDKTFKWSKDLTALNVPNDIFGKNPPVPGQVH